MKPKSKSKVNKMSTIQSVYIRYLHQDCRMSCNPLVEKFPIYSRATIYRYAKNPINAPTDRRQFNTGRPPILNCRDKLNIIRHIPRLRETNGSFTARRLMLEAGLNGVVSIRTMRRCLNSLRYRYKQPRRKGLISKKDLQLRLEFVEFNVSLNSIQYKLSINLLVR